VTPSFYRALRFLAFLCFRGKFSLLCTQSNGC
jgi:hypothetical protein